MVGVVAKVLPVNPLQRGRDQLIAEMDRIGPALRRRGLASTGPRSTDRGNRWLRARRYASYRASTGPRSTDRGNASTLSAHQASILASTGPRSTDRGNLRSHSEVPRLRIASTGPRSTDRGNNAAKA